MKRHIQNGVLGIGILLVILLLASCATQPNPLVGAWAFVTSSGHQRVTEWDIRGNMLYINWTDDAGKSVPLTLYKIRN